MTTKEKLCSHDNQGDPTSRSGWVYRGETSLFNTVIMITLADAIRDLYLKQQVHPGVAECCQHLLPVPLWFCQLFKEWLQWTGKDKRSQMPQPSHPGILQRTFLLLPIEPSKSWEALPPEIPATKEHRPHLSDQLTKLLTRWTRLQ